MKYLSIFLLTFSLFADDVHQFFGKHFVASYLDCDEEAIMNVFALQNAMDEAVLLSKATILNRSSHEFEGNGLTALYLLSESHASIHTYPEYRSCFVDLFTCGNICTAEAFDQALRAYLKPKKVVSRLFLRSETTEEILLP